jgi:hypothetical protein
MGWLFGKKKKTPRVPFPEGKPFDEKELNLPSKLSGEKVIHPEDIKQAAGLEESQPVKEEAIPEMPSKSAFPPMQEEAVPLRREPTMFSPETIMDDDEDGPLYIKVEVYQRILGEIDNLKTNITELSAVSKDLDNSEYNEEANFVKLKRAIKLIHDRLLQVDQIAFKS